ncbi:hypothetical protein EDD18DRAFT_1355857 [Armillaria luteobubalina]|uniref:Uncharacterized protein n=1 Tax=Armillaria luteobubalina TaxID=153913 RepID=A0AA39Q0F0_9AGAR|nr:hypothetical protein EDD18DRAFT_1355857 [Armillaria luteobubalina]
MPASVGHPKKYHSQDKLCQAHAESSARSYTKHKSKINKHHQQKYQTLKGFCCSDASKDFRAQTCYQIFEQVTNRSPRMYADRMYHRFMDTVTRMKPRGDNDEICQELMKIGELIKDITMIEDRILNAAGVGDNLAEVELIHEGMQEVECWLKDILCSMLEGIEILTKAYEDQMLLYQHVVK